MKLCVPVRVPNGLNSCVEPHLPNAEFLLFFDTKTREFEHVFLKEQQEGAGANIRFDVVLCGSMDRATKQALAEKGVQAFGTEALTAAEAIAEFEEMNFPDGQKVQFGSSQQGGCGCANPHRDEYGHAEAEGGCHCGTGNSGHGCGKGGCGCGNHDDQGADAFARKRHADALRIAVSSQNCKTVTDHAGRCRKFWVYEIRQNKVDNKTLRELTSEQTLHSSSLGADHPLDDVHVLITTGMSPFLYQRLQKGGIRGFITDESDPDRAVEMLLQKVAAS